MPRQFKNNKTDYHKCRHTLRLSIKGTDIQIKMFDDRIVVESPGNICNIS